jgi:Hint module
MVDIMEKGMVPMEKLRVGDLILTGNKYQPVYSFGHYNPTQQAEFLVLHTDDNNALEVSGNHLIYLEGKSNPVRASSIQTGDRLQPFGVTVTEIGTVTKVGIYAPLVAEASLMVNGNILASSYAALIQDTNDGYMVFNNGTPFMAQHGFIHMVLTPFRMLCRATPHSMCQSYNSNGMPHYVAKGISILMWVNDMCSTMVQAILFAVTFVLFGFMMMAELLVFGEPFLFLAIICAWKALHNKGKISKSQ